jgi:dipeptidyl aminopeptidase/acylaminoacyl peptidase
MEQGRDVWPGQVDVRYAATGHLLYGQAGTLFAVPFDQAKLEIVGSPVPVVSGVRRSTSDDFMFSISDMGTLAYIPGPVTTSTQFDLAIADRQNIVRRLRLPPRSYQTPRISPDGKRVAFWIDDGTEANVWVYDLTRPNAAIRLTFGGKNRFPVWSSDGQWIAFQSDREGDLAVFRQRADGSGVAERLTKPDKGIAHAPESWSPKDDVFLFRAVQGNSFSLWVFSMREKMASAFGGVQSENPTNAAFSPDGSWVAYHLREPGKNRHEVYIQPYPATGARYQLPVSRDNHHPVWSRNGKELFYVPGPGEMAAVSVTTSPVFAFGNPTPVRQSVENYAPGLPRPFDLTADGNLIGLVPAEQSETGIPANPQIYVVLNWFEELKQRAPAP